MGGHTCHAQSTEGLPPQKWLPPLKRQLPPQDHYIPPQRTGDKAVDKKAIQDLESTLALEDITVCLDSDEPSLITRDVYVQKLNDIKKMGVAVSVDDFGTGYTSINCIEFLWFFMGNLFSYQ